jgi:hypothetical protein
MSSKMNGHAVVETDQLRTNNEPNPATHHGM